MNPTRDLSKAVIIASIILVCQIKSSVRNASFLLKVDGNNYSISIYPSLFVRHALHIHRYTTLPDNDWIISESFIGVFNDVPYLQTEVFSCAAMAPIECL